MSPKYGVAVIGAGARGKAYSAAWDKIEEAELVSICDIDEQRTADLREEFGYLSQYTNYKEAITEEEIDIVTICVPAAMHPEVSIYAMKNNKHVICEKPMALSLAAAEKMIDTGKEYGVELAFGFQYRNREIMRKAKKILDQELIGRPVVGLCNDIRPIRVEVGKPSMHDAVNGNGGPIVDVLCHFNDLMCWFFQAEPVRVNAYNFTFARKKAELSHLQHIAPDTGIIQIEYKSGEVLNVNLCWGLPLGENTAELNHFDLVGPLGVLKNKINEIDLSESEMKEVAEPEVTIIKYFLSDIMKKGELQAGGKTGYISLATSLAAIKSAYKGCPVSLEEIYKEKPDLLSIIESN